MSSATSDCNPGESSSISGRRVAFIGKLGGMNRREAFQLVKQFGGIPVEQANSADLDMVVIGADEVVIDNDSLLSDALREAVAQGRIEIASETELWNRLGLVDDQKNIRRLYTPAMLAQLLNVPVSTIRRWHRRGLIVPAKEVHKLPYFDFQEVATARKLAEWVAAGASAAAIEKKLEQLARLVPDVERPLAQLSVIIEGRQLLLRKDEGLIEPGGQRRIDFDAIEAEAASAIDQDDAILSTQSAGPSIVRISDVFSNDETSMSVEEMVAAAVELEDSGNIADAIEMYRVSLMAGGPNAEISFRLAELLYLQNDVGAARERYAIAIELDENFVEARANLGCVLAETGDLELAIASFRGALKFHSDYPDVHYHLARALDATQETEEAEFHWQEFLRLSPTSPWADEARDRLGLPSEDLAVDEA
ncbi:MAG: MerR family transcriptional regulator [Planctomycetales bacterium]|nr:MerR family transcriptional regulator [Planctomycetales bacterium]